MLLTDENRWKSGRSYTKYWFTVQDISNVTGRKEATIRQDVCQRKLDMKDLLSVSNYIVRHTCKT